MNKRCLSPGQYFIDRLVHAALIVLLGWSVISIVACDDAKEDAPEAVEVVARISQALTVPTGTDVGTLPGRFSVAPTGVGSYVIPLWTPEGRNGLSPRLSLAYSSAAGDSPAGHGWSIQGGSSMIYRCLQNSLLFEKPHQVDFESDSYCLDGANLVLLDPNSDSKVGAEYRTQPDSFTKIVVTAVDSSTPPVPTAFDVFTQDGLKHSYGSTSDPTLVIEGRREIWESPATDVRSDDGITLVAGRPPERYGWLKGTT